MADLNGDGRLDLAIGNRGSGVNTVSVLLNATAPNASTPTFAPRQTFGTGADPVSATAADLNGDGKPDLVVADSGIGVNTVSVLLASPSGALQFANAASSVGESAGPATVTISRTGSTDGQITAIVSVVGGTATQGLDFAFSAPRTVTWADGDNANKTVSVPILQDLAHEPDETVQLALTLPANPFGATLGAQAVTTLTILDSNPAPTVSVANASALEGNAGTSTTSFTVTLSGQTAQVVTVQFATADGSATAGSDYTATSGTLTFEPGETSKSIPVTILGNTLAEPDEAFVVTLSNPTNATVLVGQAVGVIRNDDATVACTPRPRVATSPTVGGGKLNVHVEATPLNTQQNNTLQQIRFGAFQNAAVSLNGRSIASGQIVVVPAGTVFVDFTVERVAPGQATTVPFTVVDGCGEWQTFVGGGTNAGF